LRISILLSVLSCFSALALAVGLYGITREVDRELAVVAVAFRAGEGVLGAIPTLAMVGLLWLATGTAAPDRAAWPLAEFLLKLQGWGTTFSAIFFAAGSTIFSWLLLPGRAIPVALAWLPIAAFELIVGPWLLIKAVPAPH